MENSMVLFQKYGLANSSCTYSEAANAFLSMGYTSMAGNNYFSAFRFAEGILIKEDIGEASYGSFINCIRIYSIKDKTLLTERSYHAKWYSMQTIENEAIEMLVNFLKEAADRQGINYDKFKAHNIISEVVGKAMREDQRKMLENHSMKYLNQ